MATKGCATAGTFILNLLYTVVYDPFVILLFSEPLLKDLNFVIVSLNRALMIFLNIVRPIYNRIKIHITIGKVKEFKVYMFKKIIE